jgi:hypothetical protein
MDRIDTIKVPRSLPALPVAAADVAKVLAVIGTRLPRQDIQLDPLRHRMLIETAHVCGARAAEVCGLHVEDLDLRLDDEHVRIHGKDGTVRTVLLDDRGYVALLKLYLARAGYTAGPLFRASINGRGGPLSYDAAHHRWTGYCDAAGAIRRVTERPGRWPASTCPASPACRSATVRYPHSAPRVYSSDDVLSSAATRVLMSDRWRQGQSPPHPARVGARHPASTHIRLVSKASRQARPPASWLRWSPTGTSVPRHPGTR